MDFELQEIKKILFKEPEITNLFEILSLKN